jgi:hypothetical protein
MYDHRGNKRKQKDPRITHKSLNANERLK